MTAVEEIAARFGLHPHPGRGGWWAPGPRTRNLSSITYLLTDQTAGFATMHRLGVDEGWRWLAGAPAAFLTLRPRSRGRLQPLTERDGEILVKAGTWQGAASLGPWTLAACWCSPAFTWSRFEAGEREALATEYPDFASEIAVLTPDSEPPELG